MCYICDVCQYVLFILNCYDVEMQYTNMIIVHRQGGGRREGGCMSESAIMHNTAEAGSLPYITTMAPLNRAHPRKDPLLCITGIQFA